ncbi:hypothetical protein K435DRAFT_853861 [Dendrothele bispora CBS 962.96]|uniref:Uncharacterized protein n=1 Tax=Dendrothele bispora (strain CBS 962.96) TaxID=1314807 RepID=A0A4S8MG64_DENBC|nr:hypothetical protein K435DRAFT_853861 [Dendrothele bispora CBS 962.96]
MPSSSPDEGIKLSRLRPGRRINKILKPTARPRLKFLRHSNSRSAASSSSYSDRLTSLTQSAEHYPHLKALADIVTVLYSNVNRSNSSRKQRAIGWRSVEILEAVAEAIPDPSQISLEMCKEISHLKTLFCDINNYFDPVVHTTTPRIPFKRHGLRSRLDTAYFKFVLGKKPRTLKNFRVFRVFSVQSVADISTTTLRVVDRASDAFPPLKSAVGGALALNDVTQGANACKARAQQLKREISDILENVSSDSDISTDLESLRDKLPQLDVIYEQSFSARLRNLNRNKDYLSTLEADVSRLSRKTSIISYSRTRTLYVLFSVSLALF